MKNEITIGTWWKQMKDQLEQVAQKFPTFAGTSEQYKIIHKAAVAGIDLDSFKPWTANSAGGIVRTEMAKLTNKIPSFETAHAEASLAFLAAFKKSLEDYQNVVYSDFAIKAAKKIYGEDLPATFDINAHNAKFLETIINEHIVEIKSGQTPTPVLQITGTVTTTMTSTFTATAVLSETGSPSLFPVPRQSSLESEVPKMEEKRELSPQQVPQNAQLKSLEQQLKHYDREIRVRTNYLQRLEKLEEKLIPGIKEQIVYTEDLLEENQIMKRSVTHSMICLQATALVDRILDEIKSYPKLKFNYQTKIRQILSKVLEGENTQIFLTDLLGVDQNKFQEGLNSLLQISKKTVEAAIYFEDRSCRINLGGRQGPALTPLSLEKALFWKSETTLFLL